MSLVSGVDGKRVIWIAPPRRVNGLSIPRGRATPAVNWSLVEDALAEKIRGEIVGGLPMDQTDGPRVSGVIVIGLA